MNGVELVKNIRRLERENRTSSRMKIIMISGNYMRTEEYEKFLRDDTMIDDYLKKPIALDDLV